MPSLPWAWQIAQASASAASADGAAGSDRSRITIACTCSLAALPCPTTACLTCRAVYSETGKLGEHGGGDGGAARLAEQQRRMRIDVHEHFLDGDFAGLVHGDDARQIAQDELQPRGQFAGGVADAAAGDVAQAFRRKRR